MSTARIADGLIEQARSIGLLEVLQRHGGVELRKQSGELVGACLVCGGGVDRFAIKGELFHCRGCGRGGRGAIDFEMFLSGSTFADAVRQLVGNDAPSPVAAQAASSAKAAVAKRQRQIEEKAVKAAQHRKAGWLWSQRKPIEGSIADEPYLRRVRGITCALPPTLGYLAPTKPEHHPAMIAAFALVDEPEPGMLGAPRNVRSVHLTLLKPDGGGKADVEKPKLIIGSPEGLPIVLAPVNDLGGLAIVEGVEDGLSALTIGLGVWVAGSCTLMPALADVVPSYVECVTIFAHDDTVGLIGANTLAHKLHQRGIEVRVEVRL